MFCRLADQREKNWRSNDAALEFEAMAAMRHIFGRFLKQGWCIAGRQSRQQCRAQWDQVKRCKAMGAPGKRKLAFAGDATRGS